MAIASGTNSYLPGLEKKGGYPAGSKPAAQLRPPPSTVARPASATSGPVPARETRRQEP